MEKQPEKEHHWHEPTTGQVVKAMCQYLSDKQIGAAEINAMIVKKIDEAVRQKIEALLQTDRFDKLIATTVATIASNERKAFENNSYGMYNRIRDLVNEKIKEIVMNDYEVIVKKRT